jgi:ribonucleoside-diphosphate reductase alpha chain
MAATGSADAGPAPDGDSEPCPECGSLALYFSEGCKTCESCGWSEC